MTPTPRELTTRDLARLAGVDQSTVSRALHSRSGVGSATRQKILLLAERHGYAPNPLISACMTLRRRVWTTSHPHTTLAYLIDHPAELLWRPDLRLLSYNGALSHAERRGYRLEKFVFQPGLTAKRACQILQTRNIHGVIVAPLYYENSRVDFPWEHFCAVAIGHSLKDPPLHHVAHNYYWGMQLALRECRKRGLRRIAFIGSDVTNKRIHGSWMAAYLLEQQSWDPSERLPPFVAKGSSLNDEAVRDWVLKERPDCVVGLPMGLAAGNWREYLRSLPAAIEWVSLDVKDPEGDEAGIYQDHEKIGAAATDLLISLLELNQRGPLKSAEILALEGSWVEGRRLAAAAGR